MLLFFASVVLVASAASLDTGSWQKVLGGSGYDQGNGIEVTADGGSIAIGTTSSSNNGDVGTSHGGDDIWVVKLDSSGTILWKKMYGGTGNDHGIFIDPTDDGGYIFVGDTTSSDSGDVGHNHGNWDIWVVKLDGTGTVQWQQVIGGSGLELGKTIHQTPDGGYILCGNQNWGGFVARLDSNGAVTWQELIGQGNAEYQSVWLTDDSGYILAGWTYGYTNPGGPSAWVTKIDSGGTIQWNKVLGGSADDNAIEIQQTSDGGFVFIGSTASGNSGDVGQNHGDYDIWVVKLDSTGSIQWQRTLGGNGRELGRSIRQTDDGGFILSGDTTSSNSGDVGENHGGSDYWAVKLDNTGSIQWQTTLGGRGNEEQRRIRQTADGGYILMGDTTSSDSGDVGHNHGSTDFWIVKVMPPSGGKITVTSSPPGAEIVLDNTDTGLVTPFTLTYIPAGLHAINVTKTWYYPDEQQVSVTTGETTTVIFDLVPIPPAIISGLKFNDTNENGIRDTTEESLAGWTITIKNPDGTTDTNITSADGTYTFSNLLPGAYMISEVQQAGWTQTSPAGGIYSIPLAAGQELTGFDFGNKKETVTPIPEFPAMIFSVVIITGLAGAVYRMGRKLE